MNHFIAPTRAVLPDGREGWGSRSFGAPNETGHGSKIHLSHEQDSRAKLEGCHTGWCVSLIIARGRETRARDRQPALAVQSDASTGAGQIQPANATTFNGATNLGSQGLGAPSPRWLGRGIIPVTSPGGSSHLRTSVVWSNISAGSCP